MTADAPLSDLAPVMEELAQVSDDLRAAIATGQATRVRPLLDRTRGLRAQADRANQRLRDTPPADGDGDARALLARVDACMDRVRAGEEATRAWLARPLPSPAQLLADRAGAALLVDALLPLAWDVGRDIALVAGGGGRFLIEALRARGQQRVLVLLPPGSDAAGAGLDGLAPPAPVIHGVGEVRTAIVTLPGEPADQVATLTLPPADGASLPPAEVQQIAAAVLDNIGALRAMQSTLDALGRSLVLQGIANLPRVARWPPISALRAGFRGRPLVIVSPGPSLQRNIQLLHQLKGRALILAVNRAAQAVARAGVAPDLVIIIDPLDLRYHFDGVDLAAVGALIASATTSPAVLELPFRRRFLCAGNSEFDDWIFAALGENERLPSGGSVACSALSLGLLCGCDPIMLIGQDLAFSGDQFYDATASDGGTPLKLDAEGRRLVDGGMSETLRQLRRDAGRQPLPPQRIEEVAGFHGGTVRTSVSMRLFLRWFENAAREARQAGPTRLWNCTEGGAFIDGFEHLPLAEAARRLPDAPFDVGALLDEAAASVDRATRVATLHQRVQAMQQALGPCTALAERCIRLAEQARQTPATLPALEHSERTLLEFLGPLQFISIMAQEEIRQALAQSQKAGSLAEGLAASLRFFQIVAHAAALVAAPLERAAAELARLHAAL